jgi:hypothetical protein
MTDKQKNQLLAEAKSEHFQNRVNAASNNALPSLFPNIFAQLAEDERVEVREAAAGNESAAKLYPQIFEKLAEDGHWAVRQAAAGHPACAGVRCSVALFRYWNF